MEPRLNVRKDCVAKRSSLLRQLRTVSYFVGCWVSIFLWAN